jgi:flagellar basal body-associated protein FliL
MSKQEIQTELRDLEFKLTNKYSRWFKLFILITVLLIVLLAVVFFGIFVLGFGSNWALISLNSWIITLCLIFVLFIVLELVFYFHLSSVKNKRIESEKPTPEYINGKRVYVYTYPKGAEGGIFSKTYIEIDAHNVLRLRSLVIPPEELWGSK